MSEISDKRRKALAKLEKKIGYAFKQIGILDHTLMHKSYVNEHAVPGQKDNGVLEFLGDAILGFIISDFLYRAFPDVAEGKLSKIKAFLVSTSNLAKHSEKLKLGKYLLLGRGEEKTQGRRKESLLADTYEALIAGMYLDGGMKCARTFLKKEFEPKIKDLQKSTKGVTDYKSTLQEFLQRHNLPNPYYKILEEKGPDHEKTFVIELLVSMQPLTKGTGKSKKEAQQKAATKAYKLLKRKGVNKIFGDRLEKPKKNKKNP